MIVSKSKADKEKEIKIKCRGCSKQLKINSQIIIKKLDLYNIRLGINFIILNQPSTRNDESRSKDFDNFLCFCKQCYQDGSFYPVFNSIHQQFYMQQKQVQTHFLQIADNQIKQLKITNNNLTSKLDYLLEKNHLYEIQLQKITAKIKMEDRLSQLKINIENLNQKIKNYVQASHKIITQAQPSIIEWNYEETWQDQQQQRSEKNECNKTIHEMCCNLSQMMFNYSNYEIECQSSHELSEVIYQLKQRLVDEQIYQLQKSTQVSLKSLQRHFKEELENICYQLQQQYKQIQKNKKQRQNRLTSLKQQFQTFAISVQCSSCSRMLFIDRLHYKKVGKNHFNFQLKFCIFNSAFKDQKGIQHVMFNTFEVFCQDCYKKGKYLSAFIQKHRVYNPTVIKSHEFKVQPTQREQKQVQQIQRQQKQMGAEQKRKRQNQGIINQPQRINNNQLNPDRLRNNSAFKRQYDKIIRRIQQKQPDFAKRQLYKNQANNDKQLQKGQKNKNEKLQKLKKSTKNFIFYLIQREIYQMKSQFNMELFCSLQIKQYYKIIYDIYCRLAQEIQQKDSLKYMVRLIYGQQSYLQQIKRRRLLNEIIQNHNTFFPYNQEVNSIIHEACEQNYVPFDDPLDCDYLESYMNFYLEEQPQFPELVVIDSRSKNNLNFIYQNKS